MGAFFHHCLAISRNERLPFSRKQMLTHDDVRVFLRDSPKDNRLTDEYELSGEQIDLARKLTIADFNESAPFTGYTVENFPFEKALLLGICCHLYEGLASGQLRNQLPYSTGGVAIDDSNKGPIYLDQASKYRSLYELKKREAKQHMNLEVGWASVRSDYG